MIDSFDIRSEVDGHHIVDLRKAATALGGIGRLPITLRILLENLLRNEDGVSVTAGDIRAVAARPADWNREIEIAFRPARVVMQDYAGMPVLIDLAALRDKAAACGLDPTAINPEVPADLVVDHSLMVHAVRCGDAAETNLAREMRDNAERFAFVKWAQQAYKGLRIVPPGQGIIHQINIEYLAEVVAARTVNGDSWLLPDTVIGTDSHTPMVNGLGVVGWGVGGIEAEAVMLGEPVSMLVPPVIGVKLNGSLPEGVLATDLVLTLTETFRQRGVVGSLLEFFGPGVAALPLTDRATIANMTPEFGATCSFFPTDQRTLDYLNLTGRDRGSIERVERYLKRNGLWFDPDFVPDAADVVEFDLSVVRRTVSGPKRPEERRDVAEVPAAARGLIGDRPAPASTEDLKDGDIVIAAITSCTNTSNPAAMVAAGLLARKARAYGLSVAKRIKTSLAPGSRVVHDYLERAGLSDDLAALGFDVVGYGCTTCVGNSGPLAPEVIQAIDGEDLCVAAVLSGNRNFEGRIHAKIKANFLASPPLVVAFALAGSVLKNLEVEPLGFSAQGHPVMLDDIWPSASEINAVLESAIDRDPFVARYAAVLDGGEAWRALDAPTGSLFPWPTGSTYFQRPPFFDLPRSFVAGEPMLDGARPLLILGDSVTTDHISPVGAIAPESPAADYLIQAGVQSADFNAYGARRGDHNVMVRGTFANVRLRNEMVEEIGGWTRCMPDGAVANVFDAGMAYAGTGVEVVVIAGKMYGAGSARDWAAKGTRLLGIRAVIAESFERIHRSNLVRMGVLPLEFADGVSRKTLGIDAESTVTVIETIDGLAPRKRLSAVLRRGDGTSREFQVTARVDTLDELRYLRDGGILTSVAARILPNPTG